MAGERVSKATWIHVQHRTFDAAQQMEIAMEQVPDHCRRFAIAPLRSPVVMYTVCSLRLSAIAGRSTPYVSSCSVMTGDET